MPEPTTTPMPEPTPTAAPMSEAIPIAIEEALEDPTMATALEDIDLHLETMNGLQDQCPAPKALQALAIASDAQQEMTVVAEQAYSGEAMPLEEWVTMYEAMVEVLAGHTDEMMALCTES